MRVAIESLGPFQSVRNRFADDGKFLMNHTGMVSWDGTEVVSIPFPHQVPGWGSVNLSLPGSLLS